MFSGNIAQQYDSWYEPKQGTFIPA